MEKERPRIRHSPEFRIEIAERMLAGEKVTALSVQHGLPRSMMYRWRNAYRKEGSAALSRPVGRPSGSLPPVAPSLTPAGDGEDRGSKEKKLRKTIAELERKVGRQAVEIDFFKGVFKRLEELPKASRHGGKASTRRSGE